MEKLFEDIETRIQFLILDIILFIEEFYYWYTNHLC
jgi:hypothetical protein